MRSHKVEPYKSVMDALAGSGCPVCRYLRNFQLKCVQSTLYPRPALSCNFHAWAIAATHDRLDASQTFLKLLSSTSFGGEGACDICSRIQKEDSAQLRLIAASFKTLPADRWLATYGEICIPHSLELRKSVDQRYCSIIDRAILFYRDRLIQTLREQQSVDINGAGWGVLGQTTEFLTGQRGLYR